MTISELIEVLEERKKEYGDIKVFAIDKYGDCVNVYNDEVIYSEFFDGLMFDV